MSQKLSQQNAANIYLIYMAANAINEYVASIISDKESQRGLKDWASAMGIKSRFLTNSIETRVAHDQLEQFREQVKNNDPIRFDNIRDLMVRMSPKQQEILEDCAIAIVNKEFEIHEK
jgi:hypothetical protein